MDIKIPVPDDVYVSARERASALGYDSVADYAFALILLDRDRTCLPDVENKIFDRFMSALKKNRRNE